MIVAAVTPVFGRLLVALVTQLFGYRRGGTIAVPVLAVYTLKNVLMFPVFVASTIITYGGLYIAERRTGERTVECPYRRRTDRRSAPVAVRLAVPSHRRRQR